MSKKIQRMYVDTSAIGGVFDDDPFAVGCKPFFELVRQKKYIILVSDVTQLELENAPGNVGSFLGTLPTDVIEFCQVNEEIENLAQSYIDLGVLTSKSINDARHVATATVYDADYIVSCNFKHLVNAIRIAKFNAVNVLKGYGTIDIKRPEEVIDYDISE